MPIEFDLPKPITCEVVYPECYEDRDWAGEQQERVYYEAWKAMKDLYGPKVPEFDDFPQWLEGKVLGEPDGHF